MKGRWACRKDENTRSASRDAQPRKRASTSHLAAPTTLPTSKTAPNSTLDDYIAPHRKRKPPIARQASEEVAVYPDSALSTRSPKAAAVALCSPSSLLLVPPIRRLYYSPVLRLVLSAH